MAARSKRAPSRPRRPSGLSKAAGVLWERLQREYRVLDAAGLAVLEQALRAFDRAEEARRLLDREGCVVKDRWGQVKLHPAASVERDARAAFLSALKQLG